MHKPIELQEKDAQPVLSIRTRSAVGALPQVLGAAFGEIMSYLGEMGAYPAGMPFVGYYNMDMQDLDIEVGFPVAQPLAGRDEIKPGEIPAGKRLSCLYQGPYNEMESTYNEIMEWVAANGHTWTGASYEFYLNSPMEVPESELLTEIVLMLK